MSRASNPEKRIPKSLGTDTALIGSYSLSDFVVAGLPGVAVILGTQAVVPPSLEVFGIRVSVLAIPLAVLAIGVGALFVYLTPAYTSSVNWLGQFARFYAIETEFSHAAVKAKLPVERVHPHHDAIERSDGALVGAIQVTPPTMALATDEEWAAKADAFQDFVNTTVDFPIQIFSTTRPFPVEEYLGHYEKRLSDPDVEDNEQLAALLDHYTDWYGRELAQRQMTIRDHYVLVTVRPDEAHYDQESLLDELAKIPVLGTFIRLWTAPPPAAEHAAMLSELGDRLRCVERGLRTIEGCGTSTVDATDLTRVVAEYWTGSEFEYGDPEQVIRTSPIVTTTDS